MDFCSRISLRHTKLSDVDDFLNWSSDESVARQTTWEAIKTKEEALSHIENFVTPHPWYRMICLDDRSIGFLSVTPREGLYKHSAHVSYAIGADWWGQGAATTALRLAVPLAFKELNGLVRLETLVEHSNIASQRVLEKVGFAKEGFMRKYGFCKGEFKDVFSYGFLVTDKVL